MMVVLQWYVSYEEVARAESPGQQEHYPPYCSGWLWVTSPGTQVSRSAERIING